MITPDWPAPPNVHALITERSGGHSAPPFNSFNLATHVGDQPTSVAANRRQLADLTGVRRWQWLEQIHSALVITANADGSTPQADGATTREAGLALSILTADCLPVLLCNTAGTQVGAVHAGWRGLASGILAAAVARFHSPGSQLLAYLGPCISQTAFEVGPEVRQVFLALGREYGADWSYAFTPSPRPDHWLADLYSLARGQLQACGLTHVYGGGYCTFSEPERFFSFRRDGQTGRMASVIWLQEPSARNPS